MAHRRLRMLQECGLITTAINVWRKKSSRQKLFFTSSTKDESNVRLPMFDSEDSGTLRKVQQSKARNCVHSNYGIDARMARAKQIALADEETKLWRSV